MAITQRDRVEVFGDRNKVFHDNINRRVDIVRSVCRKFGSVPQGVGIDWLNLSPNSRDDLVYFFDEGVIKVVLKKMLMSFHCSTTSRGMHSHIRSINCSHVVPDWIIYGSDRDIARNTRKAIRSANKEKLSEMMTEFWKKKKEAESEIKKINDRISLAEANFRAFSKKTDMTKTYKKRHQKKVKDHVG